MAECNEINIVGAGSAGLSAAVFLHEKGYKIRIFDKRERTKITKALGINPNTLQLFEKSGITNSFIKNGWKLETANFWFKEQLLYKNKFSDINHAYPYMIVQPQFETENIIEEYLNQKGIYVERQFELKDLKLGNDFSEIVFENVHTKEALKINQNQIIIGADGSKSKVRELANIKLNGWEHETAFKLYDIELETPMNPNELHYIFHREGVFIMLHIREGIWRVGGNLANVLEYLPVGTKTGKILWETNFTIKEMVAETLRCDNAFLLGDAAHIHSPLGAKGMNMCIEDAYIFAEYLSNHKIQDFSQHRLKKLKSTVGILGHLTEYVGGQNLIANNIRGQMKNFKFVFPLIMPYMKKFLLGLN